MEMLGCFCFRMVGVGVRDLGARYHGRKGWDDVVLTIWRWWGHLSFLTFLLFFMFVVV